MNKQKVDLMQAFSWICPECGKRNFEKAIAMEMDSEKEKEIKEGISACDYWMSFTGGLFMGPSKVSCVGCNKKFEVNQEEEETEEN